MRETNQSRAACLVKANSVGQWRQATLSR